MPLWDWQFVVVTLIAAAAVTILLRRFLPAPRKPGAPPQSATCAHCASNAAAKPAASAPRTTTVPVVSLNDLRETARRPTRAH